MTRVGRRFRRRGWTLVEMVLAMSVSTLVMGGLTATLLTASRLTPDSKGPLRCANEASWALERIGGELLVLRDMLSRSKQSISFSVGDRDMNNMPESISYAWSGTPGDSLTRTSNNGPAEVVAEDVHVFDIEYRVAPVAVTTLPVENESGEVELYSYNATSNLGDKAIANSLWVAQCFAPALPADAISWKVKQVDLVARAHGANKGVTRIELRLPTVSGTPSTTVLEGVDLVESTLTDTYEWRQFTFNNVSGLSPSTGLCIVVRWISDAHSCDVQYRTLAAPLLDSYVMSSSDSGSTWTAAATQTLLFRVYGTYTLLSAPGTTTLYHLIGARLRLQIGTDASALAETSVQILNRPEVAQ